MHFCQLNVYLFKSCTSLFKVDLNIIIRDYFSWLIKVIKSWTRLLKHVVLFTF